MEVASAALADTVEAASAIRVAPVAMPTKNDQKCSQPRNRGRVVRGEGSANVATLTASGYAFFTSG